MCAFLLHCRPKMDPPHGDFAFEPCMIDLPILLNRVNMQGKELVSKIENDSKGGILFCDGNFT